MINLRLEKKPKVNVNLQDPNVKRLTKLMKEELENLVPLHWGPMFEREGYDSLHTRSELLNLLKTKVSFNIIRLEVMRRKRMKRKQYV